MRILAGIVGLLCFLLGGLALASAVVSLGNSDSASDRWTCSAGSAPSTSTCIYDGSDTPSHVAHQDTKLLVVVVSGAAFLVAGAALLGGAVAGGRTSSPAAGYPTPGYSAPQPVAAGGPPSYGGGGWPTTQQAPAPPVGPPT